MFKVLFETPSGGQKTTLVKTNSEYEARMAVQSRRDCYVTLRADPVPTDIAEKFAAVEAVLGVQAALAEIAGLLLPA